MPRRTNSASRPQKSKEHHNYDTRLSPELKPASTSVPAAHIEPLTKNQDRFLSALRDPEAQIVIGLGAAGSGKTHLAVNSALNILAKSKKTKLIFSRAAVPTGRSVGFFPGGLQDKLEPWFAPMISVLKERASAGVYQAWLGSGKLELLPLETIRGRSFNDCVVIIDEAQNLTVEEVKSIVTRVGHNTKLILTGDLTQSDQRDPGLHYLLKIVARDQLPIPFILFEAEDVVRSDTVGKLVKSFMSDSEDAYRAYRYYAERD